MLEKFPKESVEKKEVVGNAGFAEDQGTRESMEDAHVVERNFMDDPRKSFFAVYDGHHGEKAAEFAAKNLHKYLATALEGGDKPVEALKKAFVATDAKMVEEFKGEEYEDSGAAALAAFVDGGKVWIAGAGDVRAVLVKENSEEALSRDHHPDDPTEAERVISGGGIIQQWAKLRMPDGSILETEDWNNPKIRRDFSIRGAKVIVKDSVRVCRKGFDGMLNMSRSLGDAWVGDAISPEPEIKEIEIQPDDRKLIIACDGVWNVISNTMAAEIVRGKTAQEASEAIVREINQRQKEKGLDQDNVTVLVIDLNEQGGAA